MLKFITNFRISKTFWNIYVFQNNIYDTMNSIYKQKSSSSSLLCMGFDILVIEPKQVCNSSL